LDRYLEEYYGKDIETIIKEASQNNEEQTEIGWGKPEGEEVS